MAGSDDDDGFSDEDLDALTAHDFYQLQENAIRPTQAATQAARAATAVPASFDKPTDEASSDYGEIDDDLMLGDDLLDDQNEESIVQPAPVASYVNPTLPGESTQREQWRQNRYAANQVPAAKAHRDSFGPRPDLGFSSKQVESRKPQAQAKTDQDVIMLDSSPQKGDSPDVAALQAKIAELLSEKSTLQKAVKAANDNAFAKAGEAAIVRSKQEKLAKEHNQQIAALQKSNAELVARQKAELEMARTEAEKVKTRNNFLEHEVQEEALRARQLQKKANAPKELPNVSLEIRTRPQTTAPVKKKQVRDHGDGFDDDAFAPLSPSKGKPQKAATPKAGEKRKRKAVDKSPGIPLRLTQPVRADSVAQDLAPMNPPDDSRSGDNTTANVANPTTAVAVPTLQPVQKPDFRFDFTQKILKHRPAQGSKCYVDQLEKYAYASDPETSLSSLFLQKLAALRVQKDQEFPTSVASVLLDLWAQCLDEKYNAPLSAIIPLITYTIILAPMETAPRLVKLTSLITITQLTADINIISRFKRTPSSDPSVDPTPCLELLLLIARCCISSLFLKKGFWRQMRFDFIYMVVVNHQPFRDVEVMLKLLETSVQENLFAMIVPPGDEEQPAAEAHIIDRVTLLLVDPPKPIEPPPRPVDRSKHAERSKPVEQQPKLTPDLGTQDPVEIATLRYAAISFLDKICDTDHGADSLARHSHAIGRLVRMVNDELNRVYEYRPGHEISTELVNRGTLLLHFLITTRKEMIDMSAKLAAVPGGKDKFMIAMTRLALCEPVYFEKGIEEAAIECAHELLDEMVDHKEAREANEVFGRGG